MVSYLCNHSNRGGSNLESRETRSSKVNKRASKINPNRKWALKSTVEALCSRRESPTPFVNGWWYEECPHFISSLHASMHQTRLCLAQGQVGSDSLVVNSLFLGVGFGLGVGCLGREKGEPLLVCVCSLQGWSSWDCGGGARHGLCRLVGESERHIECFGMRYRGLGLEVDCGGNGWRLENCDGLRLLTWEDVNEV